MEPYQTPTWVLNAPPRAFQAPSLRFFVPGHPITQGSKRPFNTKSGKIVVIEDHKVELEAWRASVSYWARKNYDGPLITGPVRLDLTFFFLYPKKWHVGGNKANPLKKNAPKYHTSKPDRLKLARSVEDALTKVIFVDDSRTATGETRKVYSVDGEGVLIEITFLKEG